MAVSPGDEASDLLVKVWRLLASGRADDARARLMAVWSWGMDGLANRQDSRVALRLFERLRFSTDDADEWATLPDPVTVYRVGREGSSWTIDREYAEHVRSQMGSGARIRTATVEKADVLAYITGYGESEVLFRP